MLVFLDKQLKNSFLTTICGLTALLIATLLANNTPEYAFV